MKERKEIQKQIQELYAKRNKYVAAKRKEIAQSNDKSLDDAMIEAVKDKPLRKISSLNSTLAPKDRRPLTQS